MTTAPASPLLGELQGALDSARVGARVLPTTDAAVDGVVDIGGRVLLLEVKAAATLMPEQARRLVNDSSDTAVVRVVIADRVVAKAREILASGGWGWLDRRGHLHLTGPGLLVDTSTPTLAGRSRVPEPLAGQVGREVASWLLLHPETNVGVRPLATRLSRAPSSVSESLSALRAAGLVDAAGRPELPALFWELAGRWRSNSHQLAAVPAPGAGSLNEQLQLALGDMNSPGWALTDTLAAAAYGAPVAVRSGHPPDFVVPSPAAVRQARLLLGSAESGQAACTVRAAPAALVCRERVDGPVHGINESWPLAHPVFVALDLATDPGRGAEILQAWTPPAPWQRVW